MGPVYSDYFCTVMKKPVLVILSFLYLVVTSGMEVQFHYCMGRLKNTTIAGSPADRCGSCGMEKKDSACCHDESRWGKVNDNHQPAVFTNTVPAPFSMHLPAVHYSWVNHPVHTNLVVAVSNHSPPPLITPDLNLLNGVFRI